MRLTPGASGRDDARLSVGAAKTVVAGLVPVIHTIPRLRQRRVRGSGSVALTPSPAAAFP
jgi:hypothetical protein